MMIIRRIRIVCGTGVPVLILIGHEGETGYEVDNSTNLYTSFFFFFLVIDFQGCHDTLCAQIYICDWLAVHAELVSSTDLLPLGLVKPWFTIPA